MSSSHVETSSLPLSSQSLIQIDPIGMDLDDDWEPTKDSNWNDARKSYTSFHKIIMMMDLMLAFIVQASSNTSMRKIVLRSTES